MKICLISSEFVPVWGGIGRYTVELTKNLPKDVDVHVVSMLRNHNGTPGSFLDNLFGENVTVHFVAQANSMLSGYPKLQLGCLRAIPQLCKEFSFDIIHSQVPTMPDILPRLLGMERGKSVCTIHCTMRTLSDSIRRANASLSKVGTLERLNLSFSSPIHFFERKYLASFRKLIAVSDFIRKEALDDFEFLVDKDVVTIHHGVDTKRFSPNGGVLKKPSDSSPVVLFAGRLAAKKGPHILIKAIPRILQAIPDAKFVFAGEGDIVGLSILARSLDIPDEKISFPGYVSEDRLPDLYRSCDVFVSPALEDSLGIRILEAMSCGKPVVATKIGGVGEIITNYFNGILVPAGESSELSESIVRVLQDRALRRKLSQKARERVEEEFSVERMVNRTMSVYKHAISN